MHRLDPVPSLLLRALARELGGCEQVSASARGRSARHTDARPTPAPSSAPFDVAELPGGRENPSADFTRLSAIVRCGQQHRKAVAADAARELVRPPSDGANHLGDAWMTSSPAWKPNASLMACSGRCRYRAARARVGLPRREPLCSATLEDQPIDEPGQQDRVGCSGFRRPCGSRTRGSARRGARSPLQSPTETAR